MKVLISAVEVFRDIEDDIGVDNIWADFSKSSDGVDDVLVLTKNLNHGVGEKDLYLPKSFSPKKIEFSR